MSNKIAQEENKRHRTNVTHGTDLMGSDQSDQQSKGVEIWERGERDGGLTVYPSMVILP